MYTISSLDTYYLPLRHRGRSDSAHSESNSARASQLMSPIKLILSCEVASERQVSIFKFSVVYVTQYSLTSEIVSLHGPRTMDEIYAFALK